MLEGEEEEEEGGREEGGTKKNDWVGGLRVVRVFESFSKPDFLRIDGMPTKLDLDVVTNKGEHDSDDEAVVPAKAQASAASSWTRHTKAPTAATSSAMAAPAEDDDDDDDELVIEDVTGTR